MVRYPREERRSIGDLERMWVQLPNRVGEGTFRLRGGIRYRTRPQPDPARLDKQRTIRVMANVDQQILEPRPAVRKVSNGLSTGNAVALPRGEPGIRRQFQRGRRDSRVIAAGGIFSAGQFVCVISHTAALYLQPLIIMSVIPFGLIGAVVGHAVLDTTISMVSIIGCISLAGVVVNDSLIMVDFVNRKTREGLNYAIASIEAGAERFRAIVLTSLTTFFGLLPIMFESSTFRRR